MSVSASIQEDRETAANAVALSDVKKVVKGWARRARSAAERKAMANIEAEIEAVEERWLEQGMISAGV